MSKDFFEFFGNFYGRNVGGTGATFSNESHLINDLGFDKSSIRDLKKELEQKCGSLDDAAFEGTVRQLADAVQKRGGSSSSSIQWTPTQNAPAKRPDPLAVASSAPPGSSCSATSEILFVQALRKAYRQAHGCSEEVAMRAILRDTLVKSIMTTTTTTAEVKKKTNSGDDIDGGDWLQAALVSQWPQCKEGVARILQRIRDAPRDSLYDGLRVTGLMAQMTEQCPSFRTWDQGNGPRGG